MLLTKFTIPNNSTIKYPIPFHKNETLEINSWFKSTGDSHHGNDKYQTNRTVLRCSKIKISPDTKQSKILDNWIDIYRYVYNQTVKYLKSNKLTNFIKLRKIIKDNLNKSSWDRIIKSRIPIHTIDNAIKDVVKAYKSSFALSKVTKKQFRIRYKKSNSNSSIVIEASSFSKVHNSFAFRILGIIKSNDNIKGINRDCRLQKSTRGYILFVPTERPVIEVEFRKECCSLDPGLRTFQTGYSKDGQVYEFGTDYVNKIQPLINKTDNKSNYQGTRWYKKYSTRLRDKIKHLTDELHWKTANYLVINFNKILIGNMSTVGILGGNLASNCKRLLQSMSHFTFRNRLESKCIEYNSEFICVDESYTSKTCGYCGEINKKLGSSKVFKCECGFVCDRDFNGARNIMIKLLQ
jgi:transposase